MLKDKEKKRKVIIPIFVSHMGCPNDCTFCNQRLINGSEGYITSEEVHRAVDERKDTIDFENDDVEIAFFGGSFTLIPNEIQEELLSAAYIYVENGLIKNIRISTRPDGIDLTVIKRLLKYKVTVVELGVQSMDENVLKSVKRGYEPYQVIEAIKLLKEYGFLVGVQIMLGLPGSSLSSELMTANKLIELKPDFARIYPTLVIKDTELEESYLAGTYLPLSLEEAVDLAYMLFKLFDKAGIEVIRIGLQATDRISNSTLSAVIAGPEHPSMGELVYSRLYLEIVEVGLRKLMNRDFMNKEHYSRGCDKETAAIQDETLVIKCNNKVVSMLSGHNSYNKKYIMNKYNIKKIKIVGVTSLTFDRVEISYCDKSMISSKNDLYCS